MQDSDGMLFLWAIKSIYYFPILFSKPVDMCMLYWMCGNAIKTKVRNEDMHAERCE